MTNQSTAYEKIKYVIFRILRIVLYHFTLLVFTAFSESMLKNSLGSAFGSHLGGVLLTVSAALFFAVALFAVTRTFALYDPVGFLKYKEQRGILSFLYRWEFWLFLAGAVAAAFLVPISPLFVREWLKEKAFTVWGSLLYCAMLLPLFFLAHLSAEKHRKSGGRFRSEEGSAKALVSKLLFLTLLYFGASMMLPFLFAMLLTGFALLESGGARVMLALLILLAVITLPLYLRAWHKRRKFLSSLKALAEQKGYKLSPIRRPYLSLLKNTHGASFTVKANGKIYTCKLYGSVNRNNAVILSRGGSGLRKCALHFGKSHFGVYGASIFSAELFSLTFPFDYSFEGEGQRVLIFTNVPKRMLFADEKIVSHLDNGDTVDGYKIFSGAAFLAGLERDTLERKMNGD